MYLDAKKDYHLDNLSLLFNLKSNTMKNTVQRYTSNLLFPNIFHEKHEKTYFLFFLLRFLLLIFIF